MARRMRQARRAWRNRSPYAPPYTARVQIELNGQPKELTGATTVAALLASLGLDKAPCAVEVNARLVRKSEHPNHALAAGDRVEVVTLVGGG